MKKSLLIGVLACSVLSLMACGNQPASSSSSAPTSTEESSSGVKVMTHAEFEAAPVDSEVCVEAYIQDKQAWWEKSGQGKGTLYTQNADGAYFVYEAKLTEQEYNNLIPGTMVRIQGFKSEWSGEVEIIDATVTRGVGAAAWVAPATDVTALLGSDDLIKHQNERVSFTDMMVLPKDKDNVVYYQWDNSGSFESNSDIYFDVTDGKAVYTFVVESYLRDNTTDVYKAVAGLKAYDKVNMEGFLYWYNGAQPHITDIEATPTEVMTHAEYVAAETDTEVNVVTYVQDKQSWWNDNGQGKGTLYCQSEDGAYFAYEAKLTEEEYNKLVPGTRVMIHGYKGEWSGEVEITDPEVTLLPGDSWFAEATDVTALLGSDDLISHQNEYVVFKNMTVVAKDADNVVYYKHDNSGSAEANSDIYFDVTDGTNTYTFVVESYLRNNTTELYQKVGAFAEGDRYDLEGYLYWYKGAQPHIVSANLLVD